ncbi:MAG: type VI secretion system tip protein VgrG [Rhodospirillales bacterium]|nr:type VI secretion system tip protein VgrG [Rhodospirillales bacterium]
MTTPVAGITLQPVRLHATEGISELFAFEVDMVSPDDGIKADDLLYQPACVTLTPKVGSPRYFHGIVREFRAEGRQGGAHSYRALLVPRLAFAGQTADCRMFYQKTALQVIETLLDENGVTHFDDSKVTRTLQQRDYVCQYNETDLAFITRLMEEEGLYYFFTFTDSAHTLVIADSNSAFASIDDPEAWVGTGTTIDIINDWHRIDTTAVGKVSLNDYDPLKPNTSLLKNTPTKLSTSGHPQRDTFHWPALSTDPDTIAGRTLFHQEAHEAFATLFAGAGSNPEFVPGGKFKLLAKHDTPDGAAGDYVIRHVVHEASEEVLANTGAVTAYRNRFSAFPVATTWRQPLVTPRPRMLGVTSAIVIGENGEEITADKYGRIKVKMMWDHADVATNDSMIWVRLLQPWAGNGWGWQHLPRQDSEVLVAFADGDIDHPIILGGLYNAQQMPPFTLPDEKNKTGLRTRSSKQGSGSTYSELSFDDTKGSELVLLHAEKDHTVEVENDHTVKIDHDQTITVKHDQTLTVNNDRTATVKNNETIEVQGKRSTTVKGDNTTEVQQGNEKLTVDQGNITIAAQAGAVKITAMQSIELTVGSNTLKIDTSGVSINGTMVKLAGTAMLDMKAPMTTLKGEAMLTLKGGIVMIN